MSQEQYSTVPNYAPYRACLAKVNNSRVLFTSKVLFLMSPGVDSKQCNISALKPDLSNIREIETDDNNQTDTQGSYEKHNIK